MIVQLQGCGSLNKAMDTLRAHSSPQREFKMLGLKTRRLNYVRHNAVYAMLRCGSDEPFALVFNL